MGKKQLSRDIDKRFDYESNKIKNEDDKSDLNSAKFITIALSIIMSAVTLGSLIYTLIESIKQ